MKQTRKIANPFTKSSQHRNVSVVFLAQNLFSKNRFARTISLNAKFRITIERSTAAALTVYEVTVSVSLRTKACLALNRNHIKLS